MKLKIYTALFLVFCKGTLFSVFCNTNTQLSNKRLLDINSENSINKKFRIENTQNAQYNITFTKQNQYYEKYNIYNEQNMINYQYYNNDNHFTNAKFYNLNEVSNAFNINSENQYEPTSNLATESVITMRKDISNSTDLNPDESNIINFVTTNNYEQNVTENIPNDSVKDSINFSDVLENIDSTNISEYFSFEPIPFDEQNKTNSNVVEPIAKTSKANQEWVSILENTGIPDASEITPVNQEKLSLEDPKQESRVQEFNIRKENEYYVLKKFDISNFITDLEDEFTNSNDGYPASKIFKAIECSDLILLRRLITSQTIHLTDENNYTPLMKASLQGNIDMVRYLVKQGSNVFAFGKDGKQAFTLAKEFSHKAIENLLRNHIGIAQRLYEAILNNKYTDLYNLIRYFSADINTFLPDGSTLLLTAIYNRNINMTKWLIQRGADVNKQEMTIGLSPLHLAIFLNEKNIICYLLENNANVNLTYKKSVTPVQLATSLGYSDIVDLLLQYGAHINTEKEEELSVLSTAKNNNSINSTSLSNSQNGQEQINDISNSIFNAIDNNDCRELQSILDSTGVDVNMCQRSGMKALEYVIQKNFYDIADCLINHNASIFNSCYNSKNALQLTKEYNTTSIGNLITYKQDQLRSSAKECNLINEMIYAVQHNDIVNMPILFDKGVDLNEIIENGQTSLLALAIQNNNYGTTNWLIENGADLYFKRKSDSANLFHISIESNNLNMIQYLLDLHFDIDQKTIFGMTPLHIAVQQENTPVIEFLIKKGASVDIVNSDNLTAVNLAEKTGNQSIVYLIKSISEQQIELNMNLMRAIIYNNAKRIIIPKNLTLRSYSLKGMFPLIFAIKQNRPRIAKQLITLGANTKFQRVSDGADLLHIAIELSSFPMVRYFLENNFDVNRKIKNGMSRLHLAAKTGNLSIFKYLVEKGAELETVDNKNHTALEIAEIYGKTEIANFFRTCIKFKNKKS